MYTISNYVGEGCSCRFYNLKKHKDRGFKCFENKYYADRARQNQLALSQADYAPKVYSEVGRIRLRNKKLSSWGFITEKAELLCCAGNECDCCDRDYLEEMWADPISDILSDIEDMGFEYPDAHIANFGFVQRGESKLLVIIDTGSESMYSPHYCDCLECVNGRSCGANV